MSIFQGFNINASGLTAQRFRTDVISENIANVKTTRTKDGTPYRRQVVTFAEKDITNFSNVLQNTRNAAVGNGVKVYSLKEDTESDFIKSYDPSHPDADENGYVSYPNVNIITERTNIFDASRSYEANATAFEASKGMMTTGLQLGKG